MSQVSSVFFYFWCEIKVNFIWISKKRQKQAMGYKTRFSLDCQKSNHFQKCLFWREIDFKATENRQAGPWGLKQIAGKSRKMIYRISSLLEKIGSEKRPLLISWILGFLIKKDMSHLNIPIIWLFLARLISVKPIWLESD